jgi:hypothetical protein
LFLSDAQQEELHGRRRLVGDFLESSFDSEHPNLPKEYAVPVLHNTTCSLVGLAEWRCGEEAGEQEKNGGGDEPDHAILQWCS